MNKLWQKGSLQLNKTLESFETKDDILLDKKLLPFDVLGTKAHGKLLVKIGILTQKEYKTIEKTLDEILKLYKKGEFELEIGDEDVHTKIENYLISKCGDLGKKIHTARSRNDQVLTALRLFMKSELSQITLLTESLIEAFALFTQKHGSISMPGYTHMQKAMPSKVGIWAGSLKQSLQEDLEVLKMATSLVDQSPLGSAAGYSTSFLLDREYTAQLLGFSKVQENPLYCQNSRGKIEAIVLASFVSILSSLNKFASDVLLFTMSEFGFFQVDDSICTGSSIMPQKKNLDVAELIRSKVHIVVGHYMTVVSISTNLISGYNRDIQDTKKPVFESFEIIKSTLIVSKILLSSLYPDSKQLKKSMTSELFATEKVFSLVKKGVPFRHAYQQIAKGLLKPLRQE